MQGPNVFTNWSILNLGGASDDSYACCFTEKISVGLRQERVWTSKGDTKKEPLYKEMFFSTFFSREEAIGEKKIHKTYCKSEILILSLTNSLNKDISLFCLLL